MGLSDDFCPAAAAAAAFAPPPPSFSFFRPVAFGNFTATATAAAATSFAFGFPVHNTNASASNALSAAKHSSYIHQQHHHDGNTQPGPNYSYTTPDPNPTLNIPRLNTPTNRNTTNALKRKRSHTTTSPTSSLTTTPRHQTIIPKKRRLHHTLITSRLSRPYAMPTTHISGSGSRGQRGRGMWGWGWGSSDGSRVGCFDGAVRGKEGVEAGVGAGVEVPLRRAAVLNSAARQRWWAESGVSDVGKGPNAGWAAAGSVGGDGSEGGEEEVVANYDALDDEGCAETGHEVFPVAEGDRTKGGWGDGFVSEYDRLDDGEPEIGILL